MQLSTTSSPDLAPSEMEELKTLLALVPSPPPVNDFSLDAFLGECLQAKSDTDAVKESRKALSRGTVDPSVRSEMESLIRAWEVKREWNVAAAVIMFSRQKCACCEQFSVQFQGYYQRQVHKSHELERWIISSGPADTSLPRECKYEDAVVPTCENCAENEGWEVEE